MRLFIVGFSGAGKSTIGRRIAERLGYDFADNDEQIELAVGQSASDIFKTKGEAEFRRLERETLEKLSARDNIIIATGGGFASWGNNMAFLKESGKTLYMKLSPAELLSRLGKGLHKRPMLADKRGEELRQYVEELLSKREPYYLQSSIVIDISGADDDYIVEHLKLVITNCKV